jgi:hypothetical protein
LTINPRTGVISGQVPSSGVTSFSYTIIATNRHGAIKGSTVTVAVTPQPVDVAVAIDHLGPFVSGAPASYGILVAEQGSSSTPIVLTDQLPSGVTFKSTAGQGWKCSVSGSTLTCTYTGPFFFTLGFPLIVTVNVTAKPGTTIVNTVSITPNDPTPRDNTATDRVVVVAPPKCRTQGSC